MENGPDTAASPTLGVENVANPQAGGLQVRLLNSTAIPGGGTVGKRGARAASKGVSALVAMEKASSILDGRQTSAPVAVKRQAKAVRCMPLGVAKGGINKRNRADNKTKAVNVGLPTRPNACLRHSFAGKPAGYAGINTSDPRVKVIASNTEPGSQGDLQIEFSGREDEFAHVKGVIAANIDHYGWKQYGRKKISGWKYARTYYKCKAAACHATRRTQLTNDGKRTVAWYLDLHCDAPSTACASGTSGGSTAVHAPPPATSITHTAGAPLLAVAAAAVSREAHATPAAAAVAESTSRPMAAWTRHSLYFAAQAVEAVEASCDRSGRAAQATAAHAPAACISHSQGAAATMRDGTSVAEGTKHAVRSAPASPESPQSRPRRNEVQWTNDAPSQLSCGLDVLAETANQVANEGAK